MQFKLHSKFSPAGDQPQAIKKLTEGLNAGLNEQTLLGVTGSGKTFTMASVIEKYQRPTLVISHNKTLAAQLYEEFTQFFPDNAVHYFVSYYDYYQPEAYLPHTDTYIEKEAVINEEIDRLRHAATQALLNREDVLIVASVSCIYGVGSREDYDNMSVFLHEGEKIKRSDLLRQLVGIQYERDDIAFGRGKMRVSGSRIDVHLATGEEVIRVEMYGDQIENIRRFVLTQKGKASVIVGEGEKMASVKIIPAKHFMTPKERMAAAFTSIDQELEGRVKELNAAGKILESQRLERKTKYDLEMLSEAGYCNGVENYSRHMTGRVSGLPPETLIDFFPCDKYLMFVDESHATLPQVRGMYAGDRARKDILIDFGFRLPSARDNRPLNFSEFNERINQVIYVSATPSDYEIQKSKQVVEQIVRPTGLLDPPVSVRSTKNQIPDLIREIEKRAKKHERILVTTLTKRMAEELSDYLINENIKAVYLHSEIKTLERISILKSLRAGDFDCLIGVNLLREGLDLPEVSLVAILDADMQGFLRNEISLMQTMGRAARNVNGQVIMYADKISPAMRSAIDKTEQRRKKQMAYNKKHGIVPRSTKRS